MNDAIVDCARGWIGTRFHHQGRVKKTANHKGGVDCLGLLAGVAAELHLCGNDGMPLITADETDYPHRPDTARLKAKLLECLDPIPADGIESGDVLLLKIEGNPQHLAIVSKCADGNLGLIHAYAPARAVVEHILDELWRGRLEAAFRVNP